MRLIKRGAIGASVLSIVLQAVVTPDSFVFTIIMTVMALIGYVLHLIEPEPAPSLPGEDPNVLPPGIYPVRNQILHSGVRAARKSGGVIVHGQRGIGSSTLAREVARQLADRVSGDPPRLVDLLGKGPSARSVAFRVLRVIGATPPPVPAVSLIAGKIAKVLSGSKVVLLIDNVMHAGEVSWLLERAPIRGAYVIVAGSFTDGEVPAGLPAIEVPPLRPDEVRNLFTEYGIGDTDQQVGTGVLRKIKQWVRRRPAPAVLESDFDRLIERWLYPGDVIAVARMMAADLRILPGEVLAYLEAGGKEPVQEELRLNYRDAPEGERETLAMMAATDFDDFAEVAVAAMMDISVDAAARRLAGLAERLLIGREGGRFWLPQDVRALTEPPSEPARRAALARMTEFYARRAMTHLKDVTQDKSPSDHESGVEWFQAHDMAMLTTLRLGGGDGERGLARPLVEIAEALDAWFARENRLDEREETARALRDAGTACGSIEAVTAGTIRLAVVAREQERFEEARILLNRVREMGGPQWFTESALVEMALGDRSDAAEPMIAAAHWTAAAEALEESRRTRPVGDLVGRVIDQINLASLELRRTARGRAVEAVEEALRLTKDGDYILGRAHALELLGRIRLLEDRAGEGKEALNRARSHYDRAGDILGKERCKELLNQLK